MRGISLPQKTHIKAANSDDASERQSRPRSSLQGSSQPSVAASTRSLKSSSPATSTIVKDDAKCGRRCARAQAGYLSDFRRYDSSRDGDGDRVRQVYAAQFVARRIQIGLHAGERQIQNPGDVVICLASRRPDQTFLLSFRQFDRIRRQFEIDACGRVDQNSHWLQLDHIPRFILQPNRPSNDCS